MAKLTPERLAELRVRPGYSHDHTKEMRLELLDHITALEEEAAWRPIATAPKDRLILLSGGEMSVLIDSQTQSALIFSAPTPKSLVGACCGYFDDYKIKWTTGRIASWWYEQTDTINPTHWRPLPDPPEKEKPHA